VNVGMLSSHSPDFFFTKPRSLAVLLVLETLNGGFATKQKSKETDSKACLVLVKLR